MAALPPRMTPTARVSGTIRIVVLVLLVSASTATAQWQEILLLGDPVAKQIPHVARVESAAAPVGTTLIVAWGTVITRQDTGCAALVVECHRLGSNYRQQQILPGPDGYASPDRFVRVVPLAVGGAVVWNEQRPAYRGLWLCAVDTLGTVITGPHRIGEAIAFDAPAIPPPGVLGDARADGALLYWPIDSLNLALRSITPSGNIDTHLVILPGVTYITDIDNRGDRYLITSQKAYRVDEAGHLDPGAIPADRLARPHCNGTGTRFFVLASDTRLEEYERITDSLPQARYVVEQTSALHLMCDTAGNITAVSITSRETNSILVELHTIHGPAAPLSKKLLEDAMPPILCPSGYQFIFRSYRGKTVYCDNSVLFRYHKLWDCRESRYGDKRQEYDQNIYIRSDLSLSFAPPPLTFPCQAPSTTLPVTRVQSDSLSVVIVDTEKNAVRFSAPIAPRLLDHHHMLGTYITMGKQQMVTVVVDTPSALITLYHLWPEETPPLQSITSRTNEAPREWLRNCPPYGQNTIRQDRNDIHTIIDWHCMTLTPAGWRLAYTIVDTIPESSSLNVTRYTTMNSGYSSVAGWTLAAARRTGYRPYVRLTAVDATQRVLWSGGDFAITDATATLLPLDTVGQYVWFSGESNGTIGSKGTTLHRFSLPPHPGARRLYHRTRTPAILCTSTQGTLGDSISIDGYSDTGRHVGSISLKPHRTAHDLCVVQEESTGNILLLYSADDGIHLVVLREDMTRIGREILVHPTPGPVKGIRALLNRDTLHLAWEDLRDGDADIYGLQIPVHQLLNMALSAVADREHSQAPSLLAVPNPASGECTVHFTLDAPEHPLIQIVDMNGRVVVQTAPDTGSAGVYTTTLPLSGIRSGVYQLVLLNGTQRTSTPLFVIPY